MKGKVLMIVILKPRSLAGFNSNCMVICSSTQNHSNNELIVPEGSNRLEDFFV